jgi:peptidoglycan/xylan/chitin deacetylase (PgdA/CDA1 family)
VKPGIGLLRSLHRATRSAMNRVVNRFDPPIVVLMYHCVTSLESDPHLLAVSPQNFRAQMEWLESHFRVLRFEDDWPDGKDPAVVVTFDDGYANNLLEALPVLEDVGVPATFFISTGAIESGQGFWWDAIDSLLLGPPRLPKPFELDLGGSHRSWMTNTSEEKQLLHGELVALMKKLDDGPRQDCVDQLSKWAGVQPSIRSVHRPMTVEEVQTLASSPMATIGAHGVTHTALSALSRERQAEEIEGSKRKLEAWLGNTVSVYAYPYGDQIYYTGESTRLCAEAGFSKAAAVKFRGQVHRWTRPYEIPRHMVLNWEVDEFADNVSNFFIA